MSVETEADRAISDAYEHIERAVHDICGVLSGDTWGYDDYNDIYKQKIKDSLNELLSVRDRLK